jgi:hypothetical protein
MPRTIQFRVFYLPLLSRDRKVKIYKTIILPDALSECETCSLTLQEEYSLRVLENGAEENIWTLEA